MPETEMVQTGIRGLDAILMGGIPRNNITLVQGVAGSGKTLLGLEFIYRGITEFNEPGIVVIFETRPEKLLRDAAGFGWELEALQQAKKLQIVYTTPEVLEQELRSPNSLLLEMASEIGARRIFIDGIGLLAPEFALRDSMPAAAIGAHRELLRQLMAILNQQNLSAVLSQELSALPQSAALAEMTEYIADTVIQLNRCRQGRRSIRSIEVIKSRGHGFDTGAHSLCITNGKGLEVFRRVQAPVHWGKPQPSSTERSPIGVGVLDNLMGGGLFEGSTTMVIGVSGAGKTVLGTQLLREGAVKQGKRGLLVSLDEHPAQIVRNSRTIGLNLNEPIDRGDIKIIFESPQELDVDSHFGAIIATIEKYDIQRMVVDGMTSYSTALESPRVYRDFFHALVAYSKNRLMTSFFNYENPEFLGVSSYMPDFPVSSIVDNIILLNMVEINSSLHRCLTVVKARGTKHDFETREFVIGEGGIDLLPKDEKSQKSLPFQNYSSILSRAPTRFQSPQPPNGVAASG